MEVLELGKVEESGDLLKKKTHSQLKKSLIQ